MGVELGMSLPFAREPSMPMHVVQRLLEVFERMGVARAVLSRALGGRAEVSDDPDARVPASQVACLWRLALDHTQDPAFGLHWVEALNERTFAPFSYMLQEAASLRSAFELLLHFERLLTGAAFFTLLDDGDAVTVRVAPLGDPTSRQACFMAETVAAGLFRMAREVNARAALQRVGFAYPAPVHRAEYERFFACAVEFDQPFSELVFERALFDAPLPQADREVHLALKTVAERRMQRVTRATSYAARLRELKLSLRAMVNRPTILLICLVACPPACGDDDSPLEADAATVADATTRDMDGGSSPTSGRDAAMEGGSGSSQDGAVRPPAPPPRTEAKFESITWIIGGRGTIASVKVASPGSLVLADEVGEMQFALTSDEYRPVLELVLTDQFVSAIRMPNNPDCPSGPWNNLLNVVWRDIGVQSAPLGACAFAMAGQSDHVYRQLTARLFVIKRSYFVCDNDADAGVGSEARSLCLF